LQTTGQSGRRFLVAEANQYLGVVALLLFGPDRKPKTRPTTADESNHGLQKFLGVFRRMCGAIFLRDTVDDRLDASRGLIGE
jgi:hypothetical protein